jgi:hypothetical protein
MRGPQTSGNYQLTKRPSPYAGRGFRGVLNWIRDNIIEELAPVCEEGPDSLSGDEFRTPFDFTFAGNTTVLNPQIYNIEVRELFIYVQTSNTLRVFVDAVPQGAGFTLPDTSGQNLPPFTVQSGKAVVINASAALRVTGWVRWRFVQPIGRGTV